MNEGNSAPLYNHIAPLFQFTNGLVVFLCPLSRCCLVRMPSLSCVAAGCLSIMKFFLCVWGYIVGTVKSVLEVLIVCGLKKA